MGFGLGTQTSTTRICPLFIVVKVEKDVVLLRPRGRGGDRQEEEQKVAGAGGHRDLGVGRARPLGAAERVVEGEALQVRPVPGQVLQDTRHQQTQEGGTQRHHAHSHARPVHRTRPGHTQQHTGESAEHLQQGGVAVAKTLCLPILRIPLQHRGSEKLA